MTRDELLESLLIERYGCNRWWPGVHPNPPHDDEATCARRRQDALADSTNRREEGT